MIFKYLNCVLFTLLYISINTKLFTANVTIRNWIIITLSLQDRDEPSTIYSMVRLVGDSSSQAAAFVVTSPIYHAPTWSIVYTPAHHIVRVVHPHFRRNRYLLQSTDHFPTSAMTFPRTEKLTNGALLYVVPGKWHILMR